MPLQKRGIRPNEGHLEGHSSTEGHVGQYVPFLGQNVG